MANAKPRSKTRSSPGALATVYLIAYNALCTAGWAYLLQQSIQHVASPAPASLEAFQAKSRTGYAAFGSQVQWVQTLAILEPIHVALGLVRTSFGTTLAQVFSRLFVVYGILQTFPACVQVSAFMIASATRGPSTQASAFFIPMVVAWSVTEVIRYSNYVTTLLGLKVAPLEYLRYTLFYVLYPIGAGSEATFIYHAAPFAAAKFGELARYASYALSGIVWPVSLFGLMGYMHAQRRKHLGRHSKTAGKRA